MIVDHSR
jgi:hypothetical protein